MLLAMLLRLSHRTRVSDSRAVPQGRSAWLVSRATALPASRQRRHRVRVRMRGR